MAAKSLWVNFYLVVELCALGVEMSDHYDEVFMEDVVIVVARTDYVIYDVVLHSGGALETVEILRKKRVGVKSVSQPLSVVLRVRDVNNENFTVVHG